MGLIAALLPFITGFLVAPSFSAVYRSFSEELPFVTALALHFHWLLLLLPMVVVAVRFFWPSRQRRSATALEIGIGIMVFVTPLYVAAVFVPVLKHTSTNLGPTRRSTPAPASLPAFGDIASKFAVPSSAPRISPPRRAAGNVSGARAGPVGSKSVTLDKSNDLPTLPVIASATHLLPPS